MQDHLAMQSVRQQLEETRSALLAHIQDEEARLHAPVGANPDQFDLAQAYLSKERQSAVLARSKQRLEQVESALQRVAEGRYSAYVQCGERIPPSRLRVLPYATLCVRCQERQEALA